MAGPEAQVEKYLVDTIAELEGTCLKFTVPGRRGYMDRLCKLVHGSAFMVEVKRPRGGVLAALQAERRDELRGQGWRVYQVKNRGEIDDLIKRETDRADRNRVAAAG